MDARNFGWWYRRFALLVGVVVLVVPQLVDASAPVGKGPKPTPTPSATPAPTPVADLAVVGISENYDPFVQDLHPGEGLVYTVTVRNNGPDAAAEVTVLGTAQGGGLEGMTMSTEHKECTVTQDPHPSSAIWRLDCAVGPMAAGGQSRFDVTLRINCFGTARPNLGARMFGRVIDNNSANDSAFQDTIATGPIADESCDVG